MSNSIYGKPSQMDKIKIMTEEADERTIIVYLDQSEDLIKAYTGLSTLPSAFEPLVTELAAYRIIKRGADYQTAHTENGVSRSWAGDVMDSPEGFWKKVDKTLQEATEAGMGWIV